MACIVKKLFFCGARSFRSSGCQQDEEEGRHHRLPHGHIWVCVGRDTSRRFNVDANFLNHPLFEDLLRLSEDEFGHSYDGALRIACDADLFLHLVDLLSSGDPAAHYMELADLVANSHAGSL
ncbi:hypothetical protein Taro_048807 [Colocasia esculenta]|uniref:Small auxin up regulated protein n=1 Tax=Colocasia esculenta TaxID=4460 RepID=A0A843X943_COLES|nr:hypothetical protein [Colocasia esculenta]